MDNYKIALHELNEKLKFSLKVVREYDSSHELTSAKSKDLFEKINNLDEKIKYLETLLNKHKAYNAFKVNLPDIKNTVYKLSAIFYVIVFTFGAVSSALISAYFQSPINMLNILITGITSASLFSGAILAFELLRLKREEKILIDALDGTEEDKVNKKLLRSKRQHRKLTKLKVRTDNKLNHIDKKRSHLKKEINEYYQDFNDIKNARSNACTQVMDSNEYEKLINEVYSNDTNTQEIIKRERKI